jgi:transcriptional antiterminator RfaH
MSSGVAFSRLIAKKWAHMPKPSPDHPMPWFCVRAQPGRQNVAAAHLRSFGVEVFNPHLLVRKAGRNGVTWKSEPLFPNYLFARFDFTAHYRRVNYGFGVSGLVRFGERYAEVSAEDIEPLRMEWGASEARAVDASVTPGDRVRLSGALFHGVEAEVLCLLPARSRVKVLLEFLGGPKEAEVEAAAIVPVLAHPLAMPA